MSLLFEQQPLSKYKQRRKPLYIDKHYQALSVMFYLITGLLATSYIQAHPLIRDNSNKAIKGEL